ncbi:hypothetical protein SSX86_021163 [Deinandra increscens subsp. villosa]|uniref:GINS subunit domain-containing protein n=1 Tax=Deinandra increscens subsp. villosa TaxID=3103831 RepID=A0AAP0CWB5_9ASTR
MRRRFPQFYAHVDKVFDEMPVWVVTVVKELKDYWNSKMYGRKASQLLKELVSGDSGQLTGFNNDLFKQVIEECDESVHHCQALLRKMQEEGTSNQTNKNPDHYGALVHHLSLVRNKRCLMAYVYNRAEVVQNLGWTFKAKLPDAIKMKLSSEEQKYFTNHYATLQSYMKDLDLDLAVDMLPPKDPYIKVRVLEEIGYVSLGDQVGNLTMHAILFLKRTVAEDYILQGKMEELTN